MEKKKILIIILAIVLVAAVACAGFVLWDKMNQPTVYTNTIDGVGTFNSTNVTNFTYSEDRSNSIQTDYIANDSIAQVSVTSSSSAIEITKSEATQVNDSAGGHTIYKNTANVGDHKGEVRYFSILKDQDNDRYVMISTASLELTSMMVDTFKFLEPGS